MHGIISSDLLKLDGWLHTPEAEWPELSAAEEKEEEEDQMLTAAYDQLMCGEDDQPGKVQSWMVMRSVLWGLTQQQHHHQLQAFHLSSGNIGPEHGIKLCSQTK